MSRIQFSLRTLLAAVAVVGIGGALWVAEPSWQLGVIEGVFVSWIQASVIVLSIHSEGKAKGWWIGMAVQCTFASIIYVLSMFLAYALHADTPPAVAEHRTFVGSVEWFALTLSEYFRLVLAALAPAPVVGLLCVFTHWLLIRPPEPKA